MKKRGSGVLMHITSLPSSHGIGDFGPSAYSFADFLFDTHQKYWQILPLTPTDTIYHNSPYNSISAFACNPLLISPDLLAEEGIIDKDSIRVSEASFRERVDYVKVSEYKRKVCNRIINKKPDKGYKKFCEENFDWLDDYALFMALRGHFNGKLWSEWPYELRDRKSKTLNTWRKKLKNEIESESLVQYLLFKQWHRLKSYCNAKDIKIIGDMPIYVDYNSSDAWVNPGIFKLDAQKRPFVIAGVPPDYFSETGQLWGNPVYDWPKLKNMNYDWWIKRLKHVLSLYDIVRIDHFRGLVAYWEVSAEEKTAVNGKWVKAPVKNFLNTALKKIKGFSIIAEDLGLITPDVVEIMKYYGFPGMKVLQFAFGGKTSDNPYAPHNHTENCVLYTGTHDNNTTRGWFENDMTNEEKENLFRYIRKQVFSEEISWEFIRMAMSSVANTAIIPVQDMLSLGEDARMNRPSTIKDNWEWRLRSFDPIYAIKDRLKEYTWTYGRV